MMTHATQVTHAMRLNSPWFDIVKSGKKIYEGRRWSEKIEMITPGDYIEFRYVNDESQKIKVKVIEILRFNTFEEALNIIPINDVLYGGLTIEEGVEIYKKYVSIETQMRDGVCLIKIE